MVATPLAAAPPPHDKEFSEALLPSDARFLVHMTHARTNEVSVFNVKLSLIDVQSCVVAHVAAERVRFVGDDSFDLKICPAGVTVGTGNAVFIFEQPRACGARARAREQSCTDPRPRWLRAKVQTAFVTPGPIPYTVQHFRGDVAHVDTTAVLECDHERIWHNRCSVGMWDAGITLELANRAVDMAGMEQELYLYTYERGHFAVAILSSAGQELRCSAWKSGVNCLPPGYALLWKDPFAIGPGCEHAVCRFGHEGYDDDYHFLDVADGFALSAHAFAPVWPQAEVRFFQATLVGAGAQAFGTERAVAAPTAAWRAAHIPRHSPDAGLRAL